MGEGGPGSVLSRCPWCPGGPGCRAGDEGCWGSRYWPCSTAAPRPRSHSTRGVLRWKGGTTFTGAFREWGGKRGFGSSKGRWLRGTDGAAHQKLWGWDQSGKSGHSLKVEGRASSYLPPLLQAPCAAARSLKLLPTPCLAAACLLPRCFRFRSPGL